MDNNLLTFLVSTITGVVTFFIGQKRARKEIDTIALENIQNQITIYNRIIKDLSDQITTLLGKVEELEMKIDDLKKENHQLKEMLKK